LGKEGKSKERALVSTWEPIKKKKVKASGESDGRKKHTPKNPLIRRFNPFQKKDNQMPEKKHL